MSTKRTFADLGFEEKLTIIDGYLDSLSQTDSKELLSERMEWLRRHIPAYSGDSDNYVFISYSHRDFRSVYSDLAFFSYNNKKRVRFWYDEGLPAGDDWFAVASERLRAPECVGVIFYLSENLLRSPSVLEEIELVKSLGKPYFTITLDSGKFCATDYLDKVSDAELIKRVAPVFPRNDTSVSFGSDSKALFPEAERTVAYDDAYENALYRIQKIEQSFGVVENVLSDFVFEEVSDGLSLVEYRGSDTEIFIPASVGKRPVVEIKASFDTATRIYIPKSVKRLICAEIDDGTTEFNEEDQSTWSMIGITLSVIGKNQPLRAPFGMAASLESVIVDPQSEHFYDKDGVLYGKEDKLLRFPTRHAWDEKYADGIKAIGDGAFFNFDSNDFLSFPSSLESIGECAFALASVFSISFEDGVRTVGQQAFALCRTVRGEIGLPIMIPSTVESIGEFAFRSTVSPFLSITGEKLTEIPRGAFFGFQGDFISIPSSVKIIHKGAFAFCSNLEQVEMPKSLLAIDTKAFTECKKLHSIDLPRGIRYVSDEAFETTNQLTYIFYGGSSRELYYLREKNEIEDTSFVDIIIAKDEWLARLKARAAIKVRSFMLKTLEKLTAPRDPEGKTIGRRNSLISRISLTTGISFLFITAILFFMDYRRLVLGTPVDVIYWGLALIGFAISFASGKHIYWSRILSKSKRKIKDKKASVGYLDAWCSILALGLIVYAAVSVLVTVMLSGIFNLGLLSTLIGSFST